MHQIHLPTAARTALLFNSFINLPPAAQAALAEGHARYAIRNAAPHATNAVSIDDLGDLSVEEIESRLAANRTMKAAIRRDAETSSGAMGARDERRLSEVEESIACYETELQNRSEAAVPRHVVRGSAAPTRQTSPELVNNSSDTSRPTVGRAVYAQPRTTTAGSHGFRSPSEFFAAVIQGSSPNARPDPRLVSNAAPGSYGSEGVGGDGGFAVPPDFRATVMAKIMGEDALLPLTDNQTSSSNGITFPVDETTPWQSTGGIQAYWDGEGQQKIPSKPALGAKSIKLNKIIALVPLTDELLEDAPAMSNYVQRKAPEKITYRVNDAIINGTGVGMPLGILSSPGTVVVPAESAQPAGTVLFQNLVNVWSAVHPKARLNARWLLHPDVEPTLLSLQFPTTGTSVPAYMPPGGLSAAPYGTLLGKPIVLSEALQPKGLQGDIIFGDLSNYLSVTKRGGIQTDTSIHIWFDYDITAFRFVLRVGGEPWWNSPILPAHGTTARGFFATLAARP